MDGSPTIVLRPLDRATAEAIAAGDHGVVAHGAGWPHRSTADGIRLGLEHGARTFLVVVDGLVVGDCGTHRPPDDDGGVEIGYALSPVYRGRGIGREAVAQLTALLAADPAVTRISAYVRPGNVPSRRVLEHAGFAVVGDTPAGLLYRRAA